MASLTTTPALPFVRFARKQAITDAVINVILAGGGNYFAARRLTDVPLTRGFGDAAPSLFGALMTTAVLMRLLLTLIVFAITVHQRKAGKVAPPLAADVRYGGVMWWLVLVHLIITVPIVIGLGLVVGPVAPGFSLSPGMFALATA